MEKFLSSNGFFYSTLLIGLITGFFILFLYGLLAAILFTGIVFITTIGIVYCYWKITENKKDNKVYPVEKLRQLEKKEEEDALIFI
jgi:hypothetical protein